MKQVLTEETISNISGLFYFVAMGLDDRRSELVDTIRALDHQGLLSKTTWHKLSELYNALACVGTEYEKPTDPTPEFAEAESRRILEENSPKTILTGKTIQKIADLFYSVALGGKYGKSDEPSYRDVIRKLEAVLDTLYDQDLMDVSQRFELYSLIGKVAYPTFDEAEILDPLEIKEYVKNFLIEGTEE